ncbi:MAG: hypothetical protein U5K75_07115 [Ahrensia sp.]|nr:hypothetical protein [Ahrensia sp.]
MRHVMLVISIMLVSLTAVNAASLREVIRTCGEDGKKFCQGVGYGKPMQTCLSKNKASVTPKCKVLINRLDAGEKVTLF